MIEKRVLDPENIDAALAEKSILIDFHAPWCGACRTLGKILDALEEDAPGDLVLGTIDVEKFPELAARFGVTALPRLLFYRETQLIGEKSGVVPKEKILEMISR